MKHDRTDCFHAGQLWESPKGTRYRVIFVQLAGDATLRLGPDSDRGRKVKRRWDAVDGWVLIEDAPWA